ncbi:MAG: hypothetical protein MUF23_08095 [Pirellula sp.]|jgi:hypothetical protein|nr:hypothetical protein [Pirellula sp.]
MPELEPQTVRHRFQCGTLVAELQFDPYAEKPPTRFVWVRNRWRSFKRFLYRVPAWMYVSAIIIGTLSACSSAYYVEPIAIYAASAILAIVGLLLVRNFRQGVAILGVFSLVAGLSLFTLVWIASQMPQVTRGLAIPRIVASGGEVRTFGTAEWDSINQMLFPITGRELVVADIMSVRGPLEAFPPRIVQDLRLPGNVSIQVTNRQDDDKDWSSHVRAIAPKSPMMLASWWNEATIRGLTDDGLQCEFLTFDEPLTPTQIRFLASPKLRYSTLRLYGMKAEMLRSLAEAVNASGTFGTLFLTDCEIDAPAAAALAVAQPKIFFEDRNDRAGGTLPLRELDAIVEAGLNVQKFFVDRVDGEQAKRMARIPGLLLLTGVLSDATAVEELSQSKLESVAVAHADDAIVASLVKYPNLSFVEFENFEGSIDTLIPLITKPSVLAIIIRTYRGSRAQISQMKSQSRVMVGECQEIVSEPENAP